MKNDFTLLITGSENNESTAENLAVPGLDIVRYKVAYVPPYGDFCEIKKFQIRLSCSQYMKGRAVNCLLDISEWVGHEAEDHFILMLKYLHDHRSRMTFIFTVGGYGEEQTGAIYFRLRCYLRGNIATDLTFINTQTLCGYIESKGFCHDAAGLLAELIMSDGMQELRTYPVTDMICDEIREESTAEKTDIGGVVGYLNDPDSLPNILDRKITEKLISENENRKTKAISA